MRVCFLCFAIRVCRLCRTRDTDYGGKSTRSGPPVTMVASIHNTHLVTRCWHLPIWSLLTFCLVYRLVMSPLSGLRLNFNRGLALLIAASTTATASTTTFIGALTRYFATCVRMLRRGRDTAFGGSAIGSGPPATMVATIHSTFKLRGWFDLHYLLVAALIELPAAT